MNPAFFISNLHSLWKEILKVKDIKGNKIWFHHSKKEQMHIMFLCIELRMTESLLMRPHIQVKERPE